MMTIIVYYYCKPTIMNNTNSTAQPKDYPSIEAFLRAHLPAHKMMALMTTEGYPQTINGVNAIMVMANTRGTSEKIREVICGGRSLLKPAGSLRPYYGATSLHVESESTPTHASLTFLCSLVKRNADGRVSERWLTQHAFPTN